VNNPTSQRLRFGAAFFDALLTRYSGYHRNMSDTSPELSVLIVAYESQTDLARCLPSLLEQDYQDFEIVIVDNAPAHDSLWLRQHYPQVRVIENAANTGYAGGNNLAIDAANGHFLLFLNPDTVLHEGALGQLMQTARANPDAFVNSKLLNPDGTINASGLVMHYTGISTCRGLYQDPARYRGVETIPLVSGAAFVASKEVIADTGGFQELYFMYLEDIELSLRAKVLGYRILCDNEAVITHDYVQNLTANKFFYLERNRLLTLLLIASRRTLLRMSVALLLTELATWAYALLKGAAYIKARWRVLTWFFRETSTWQTLRRDLQQRKRTGDEVWFADTLEALPFDQLVDNTKVATWLDRLTRPLYVLLRPQLVSSAPTKRPSEVS
jgi:GT2 family glycosyltransferase